MADKSPVVDALFQIADACTTRIDAIEDALLALCDELRSRGAISDKVDHSSIACRISQIAAEVKHQGRGGRLYDAIVQSAMLASVLREYENLDDAPPEVQAMVRGEIALKREG